MMGPLVIFHSMNGTMHCDDGFAAACVAKMGISEGEPEFFPGIYGQEPPIERAEGRTVYLLDFSYKRPAMRLLAGAAQFLVVLDHHKTAKAELAGLTEEFITRPDLIANRPGSEVPHVHFDMDRSGAMLAWRYFFGNQAEPPDLLLRIEDGDLWRFAYPDTKLVQAALRSYPQDFDTFMTLLDRPIGELADDGVAIRRYMDRKIVELLPNARKIDLDGEEVEAVNCPAFLASEVAGTLAERSPKGWGVAYWDTATHRVFSLRSRGDGPDVSEIAARRGGGGHRGAAGFQTPL